MRKDDCGCCQDLEMGKCNLKGVSKQSYQLLGGACVEAFWCKNLAKFSKSIHQLLGGFFCAKNLSLDLPPRGVAIGSFGSRKLVDAEWPTTTVPFQERLRQLPPVQGQVMLAVARWVCCRRHKPNRHQSFQLVQEKRPIQDEVKQY